MVIINLQISEARYEGHSTVAYYNSRTSNTVVIAFVLCSIFILCWTGVDNFYDAIEDMIGYRPNAWMKWSWTIITPVLCMVRSAAACAVPWNMWHFRCDREVHSFYSKQRVFVLRAASSSPWWSTSPWPTTRCMSTLTGPSGWAGVWPCPPWSASPWWWSSKSYSPRDPLLRWADSGLYCV